jgi:hypothetical protein
MNELQDVLEYGELRLWKRYRWYYAELIFEIPAGEIKMIQARESTIEELAYSLRIEVEELARS